MVELKITCDRSIRRERGGSREEDSVGHILLGFKVMDNDREAALEATWPEWTGAGELIRGLDRTGYSIKRFRAWRAVNVKPDILKYSILVEIAGDNDRAAR